MRYHWGLSVGHVYTHSRECTHPSVMWSSRQNEAECEPSDGANQEVDGTGEPDGRESGESSSESEPESDQGEGPESEDDDDEDEIFMDNGPGVAGEDYED